MVTCEGSEKSPAQGCLFAVGVAATVLVGFIMLGATWLVCSVGRGIEHFENHIVEDIEPFTEPAASVIPDASMSAEQYDVLELRVIAFRNAVEAGQWIEPLVLTGAEISALFARHPSAVRPGFAAAVKVIGDEIIAAFSLPTEGLVKSDARLTSRYLNGSAVVAMSLVDAEPAPTLRSLQLRHPLAPELMAGLREMNLLSLAAFVESISWLVHVESVQIESSRLTITAKEPK